MALITLLTDLTDFKYYTSKGYTGDGSKPGMKSLKFGNDQLDGGSSNQPYIQTEIPDELGEYGFLNKDFILRGGSRAVTDSLIDVKRLGKYFTDFKNPSGFLFVAKQNLLSRTAVRTQTSGLLNEGIYTPLSTLAQAGVNAFGLHLNKQGLNPFDETGAYATNNENLYAVKVKPNQDPKENRLAELYISKISGSYIDLLDFDSAKINNISSDSNIILSYSGGPDSDLGIGKTNIRFADQRTGKASGKNLSTYLTTLDNTETDRTDLPQSPVPKFINNNKGKVKDGLVIINGDERTIAIEINPITPDPVSENVYTYTQKDLDELISPNGSLPSSSVYIGRTGTTTPGDFRAKLRNLSTQDKTKEIGNLANAPDYTERNIENRVNLGDPGNRKGKNLNSYVLGSISGSASLTSYDKLNTSPIYQSAGPQGTDNPNSSAINNDLVKFRIGVYDLHTDNLLKNYIHFRAFLNQISDQYTSDWDPTQYVGRGEKLYTYKGFDRKFSLSWTVAAQSKIELIPMYKKLNYLASVCAPDYSANGYMRGNIVTLTVGGYLYEQPGIITGFTYEMNEDNATWEIGINDTTGESDSSVKELPHLIKVTGFNFIPIHNFVPRLQQNGYGALDKEKPYIDRNSYGPERFIALSAGNGSNYDKQ